jgi:hypothetical protein
VELPEDLRLFLPKYLSPERQSALWDALRDFPSDRPIFTDRAREHELLQGDGWRGFVVIDFHSGDRRTVRGLILSNSCDIDPNNRRPLSATIAFAPLLNLGRYLAMLREAGQTDEQVNSIAQAMREQRVTSLMYFPGIPGQMDESVALLGNMHSHPLEHFRANNRTLIFRLNDFGFYLFLFKLSIHFSRMLEGVER